MRASIQTPSVYFCYGEIAMNKSVRVSLTTLAIALSVIATAQAETTVRTDRVSVSVGDDAVQVRTNSNAPTLRQGVTPAETFTTTPAVNRMLNCYRQSQRHQTYRTVSTSGDRIVSQSQSQTTVCR